VKTATEIMARYAHYFRVLGLSHEESWEAVVKEAVEAERERCAKEAEERCCMEMPKRVRIPCKHVACEEVKFVADRIREGPNPPWKGR